MGHLVLKKNSSKRLANFLKERGKNISKNIKNFDFCRFLYFQSVVFRLNPWKKHFEITSSTKNWIDVLRMVLLRFHEDGSVRTFHVCCYTLPLQSKNRKIFEK